MRTVTIELAGKERLLCHSTGAELAINKQFGNFEGWAKQMQVKDHTQLLPPLFAMAQILMEAGARYDEAMNLPPHEPLTIEAMGAVLDMADVLRLERAVLDALRTGQSRTVGAEPPKNAQATPGAAT